MRQYLYFCTSKASKLTQEAEKLLARSAAGVSICTFCTSKASKLRRNTWMFAEESVEVL
jgi:Cys-tRNA synthase (O-phospho-L-seryl-tRNA:Cys-tRNA synthase)